MSLTHLPPDVRFTQKIIYMYIYNNDTSKIYTIKPQLQDMIFEYRVMNSHKLTNVRYPNWETKFSIHWKHGLYMLQLLLR